MAIFRQLSLGAKAALAAGTVFVSMIVSRSYLAESLEVRAWRCLFRLQLALFANSLMLLGSIYIWHSTVSNLRHSPAAESACFQLWKMIVAAFLALAHSSFFTMIFLVAEEPYLFSLVAYACLGAYVIMLCFLCVLSGMEQAYQLLAWRAGRAVGSLDKTRKLALRPALAVMVTAVLSVVGLLNAAQPPAVTTVEVPMHRLHPSMNSLKIVLLSDIHLGPTVGRTKMDMFVRMVNTLEPDVTVIVGDLCDSEASVLRTAVAPLGQLRSRLGTYFVTGNHEYYTSDVNNWFALLKSLNVQPLHNENVRISATGAHREDDDWICLAGVDDIAANILHYTGHGMDLEKALEGCSPDYPTILLAHQPLAAKRALQARPDINLILSGHTHAGQIFPLNVAAYLLNPFFAGLYQVAKTTFVYVSPGTAYYGIPMRLGSRAEITQLILQPAPRPHPCLPPGHLPPRCPCPLSPSLCRAGRPSTPSSLPCQPTLVTRLAGTVICAGAAWQVQGG